MKCRNDGSPANAKVHFGNLKDGQTVTSPLKVEMVAEGMHVDTANGMLKTCIWSSSYPY
jgi:hypothetical protein